MISQIEREIFNICEDRYLASPEVEIDCCMACKCVKDGRGDVIDLLCDCRCHLSISDQLANEKADVEMDAFDQWMDR